MSLDTLAWWFYIWLALLAATMCCLLATFVMRFLVPKSLLKTYFKEPYFSRGEVAIFSSFPFGYMRTIMFMRLAGFPQSGKKRGLTEAYKLTPMWFRLASKIIVSAFVIFSAPMFALIPYLYFGYCVVHGPC